MPLPHRIHYRTPQVSGHQNRAGWRVDPARAVLLVHDMQRYFTRPFADDCPAYLRAVEQIGGLLAAARCGGVPVVYTAQPGNQPPAERGVMCDVWGPGITDHPDDLAVIPALAPQPLDRVQVKHRYSAFVRSDLEEWMRAQGRDQLVVTGIYGHIGVLATSTDAFMRDLQPFVVGDAIADFGRDQHEQTLSVAAGYGAVVLPAASVRARFAALATAVVPASVVSA